MCHSGDSDSCDHMCIKIRPIPHSGLTSLNVKFIYVCYVKPVIEALHPQVKIVVFYEQGRKGFRSPSARAKPSETPVVH